MRNTGSARRFYSFLLVLTLGFFVFSASLRAMVANVNTGTFKYWGGGVPAAYLYDVNQGPIVNTGLLKYWDGAHPSRYIYESDGEPPLCLISRDDASPTNAGTVDFSVEFSEPVQEFAQEDVSLTTTAGGTISGFSGGGADYTITVSGITQSGTVSIEVEAGVCADAAGNPNTAGTMVSYEIDKTAPAFTGFNSTTPDGYYKAGATINLTVSLSENVTLSEGDLVIVLETGTTDREVTISSINGADTVFGEYTVQTGDNSGDLAVKSAYLSGGTLRDAVGNDADLSLSGGNNLSDNRDIVIDTTAPMINIGMPSSILTDQGPVNYTINYSGANSVTLAQSDIILNSSGDADGVFEVTGSGTSERTVTISSITGDGTLGISLAAGTAADTAGNEAGTAGPSNVVTVDNTAPTVEISGPSASFTNQGPVNYAISYGGAAAITLSPIDVTLNTTGDVIGAIEITGSGTAERTVTISSITGDGTIGISIASGTASDGAGNLAPAAGPGSAFSVDNTDPGISIGLPSISLTNEGPVSYSVFYSGVDSLLLAAGDITLNTTGDATGSISVSGTGLSERTVEISGITGDGSIGISIASGTATDEVGNSASAAGPSATFAVDNTAPTISISSPSLDLTTSGPVVYTVTYGDANSITLAVTDLTLNKTGTADGTVAVAGTGVAERTITVSSISGDGILGISIAPGTATDDAGNLSAGSGPSGTFTVDNTPPSAPSLVLTDQDSGSSEYTIYQTVNAEITGGVGSIAWILSETVTTAPPPGSEDWEGSEPSTYTFNNSDNELKTVYLWVKDTVGNVYPTPVSATITLDTEAPAAPSITGFDIGNQGRITAIRGTVEAGCSVFLSIDDSVCPVVEGEGTDWSYSTSPPLTLGYHSMFAYAQDPVGNRSPDSNLHIGHGTFVNVLQDNETYRAGTGTTSLKFKQSAVYAFEVAVNADELVTVTAYLRKNGAYGTDTPPRITLRGLGIDGTGSAAVSMNDVEDTWQQVTVSGIPSSQGVLILEVETFGSDPGAAVWIDDLAVSQ